jgi:replication factor A1
LNKKPVIIEQLAFLSIKQSVYLSEIFQALVSAREIGKSVCMDLKINYRGSINGEAIFLITKDNKVIVQFRVPEEILLEKNLPFESWLDTAKIRKYIARRSLAPRFSILIQDLRHGMKKVNVEAEVLETPKPTLVHTRYGNSALVTNAWIADETGKIKLCLWNEQANSSVKGDIIQIKNATVSTFKGERQLCLGRKGTISVLQTRVTQTKQQPEGISKNMIYA